MDIIAQNKKAWNKQVEKQTTYTQAVSEEKIKKAREGNWEIILTAHRPVPREWFPEDLSDSHILCLASGGGQQAPILAAAGAKVTVVDISENQLNQDRMVSEQYRLDIDIKQANMTDLSIFEDETFDLVINLFQTCSLRI